MNFYEYLFKYITEKFNQISCNIIKQFVPTQIPHYIIIYLLMFSNLIDLLLMLNISLYLEN